MNKIAFLLLFCFFFYHSEAQSLQKTLGKAYLSKSEDSSNYYFKKAKLLLKTESEEGEYYFCKNARHLDFGNPDSCVYYGKIAIEKLKKANNKPSLFTVYDNLAKLYKKQGQYDKAISFLFTGLKEAEKANEQGWVALFNNQLSLSYHDFENYPKGVYYGKKALEYHLKKENPNKARIYSTINSIAINYDDWGKPNDALKYHYMVFKFMKGKDTLGISSTYNNIGNTLLKMKRFQEAEKWIKRAIKVTDAQAKETGNYFDYDYEQATHYTNLATIAYELNDFEKAERMFLLAKKHAKASKNAEKMRDYLMQISIFNKKRKDLTKMVASQEEYIKLRDSVFKVERTQSVTEMETKYQTEKKEKQLLLAKNTLLQKEAETKRKTLWIIMAFIIAGFSMLIGYLLYLQQKSKNQQQQQEFELTNALTKIQAQNELHEQRLSISRDLHDNIGSQLTFIISSVENLKFGIGTTSPKIEGKLSQISNFTKSTITELRDTIWAMNADEISFYDLKTRILNFIDKAKNSSENIQFNFTIDKNLEDIKLSSLLWVNVYRTLQEAVNNALKYANATTIDVSILKNNGNIALKIEDNGIGFDSKTIEKGNGLNNMQKRIADIGGKIEIVSTIGKGTCVSFEIKNEI